MYPIGILSFLFISLFIGPSKCVLLLCFFRISITSSNITQALSGQVEYKKSDMSRRPNNSFR